MLNSNWLTGYWFTISETVSQSEKPVIMVALCNRAVQY